tara:strand:- start:282 stop:1637 length:1356 start_codon:yes stop_codon:yes gene_type:complete
MTDLLNRANVDTAINTLLDDAQPNEAIQPSDHNGLLKDILDTLANGLYTVLRTSRYTGGENIFFNGTSYPIYQRGSFQASLNVATLTGNQSYTLPDNTGTIALLSDITGGNNMSNANLTSDGSYAVNLNGNSWSIVNTGATNEILRTENTSNAQLRLLQTQGALLKWLGGAGSSTSCLDGNVKIEPKLIVEGADTLSTTTVLELFDGDTIPNSLWNFRADGSLIASRSKTSLIAQNSTSNDANEYILKGRNSLDTSDYFFFGNGGEVRFGKSAVDNSSGDKSTHVIWAANTVTRSGTGSYSILMGHSITANYSGNDVIGLGRTIDISKQRQIAIGENIDINGEINFAIGRIIDSTASNSFLFGANLVSNGSLSFLAGKWLQSSSTGSSVIGYGTPTANLINATADSVAFGWNTTTPVHLLKSDGVNFTLPTSSAGLSSGDLWNDGGTVKIV